MRTPPPGAKLHTRSIKRVRFWQRSQCNRLIIQNQLAILGMAPPVDHSENSTRFPQCHPNHMQTVSLGVCLTMIVCLAGWGDLQTVHNGSVVLMVRSAPFGDRVTQLPSTSETFENCRPDSSAPLTTSVCQLIPLRVRCASAIVLPALFAYGDRQGAIDSHCRMPYVS